MTSPSIHWMGGILTVILTCKIRFSSFACFEMMDRVSTYAINYYKDLLFAAWKRQAILTKKRRLEQT